MRQYKVICANCPWQRTEKRSYEASDLARLHYLDYKHTTIYGYTGNKLVRKWINGEPLEVRFLNKDDD